MKKEEYRFRTKATNNKENLISDKFDERIQSVICNNYDCNNSIALPLDLDSEFKKEFLAGCWFCSRKCYKQSLSEWKLEAL